MPDGLYLSRFNIVPRFLKIKERRLFMSDKKSRKFNGFVTDFKPVAGTQSADVTLLILPDDPQVAQKIQNVPLGRKARTVTVRISSKKIPVGYGLLSRLAGGGIVFVETEVIRNVEHIVTTHQLAVVDN